MNTRYHAVAIILHWLVATAVLVNLALGWWMQQAIERVATQATAITAFQLHKSIGLSVLLLSLLRLLWRLAHAPPPLPVGLPGWQRRAAGLGHALLYALMLLIPLSGWFYASLQWRGAAPLNIPTLWFGLVELPHLFGLDQAEPALREALAGPGLRAHAWLAWGSLALLVLHVGAALWHQRQPGQAVLPRMAPRPGLGPYLLLPVLLTLGATGLGWLALSGQAPPSGEAAAISAAPGSWRPDPASEIVFTGRHAGAAFRGRFGRWQADVRIDSAAVERSRIAATIWTGSARDGVPLHDETLPEPEWFDVAAHPTARYRNTAIEPLGEGRYALRGRLQIKGRWLPVAGLELQMVEGQARISGQTGIDRAAADLGMESDPRGEWVSSRIEVIVDLRLSPP